METREALEKILQFVLKEEERYEMTAYIAASKKDREGVKVYVEKMSCFSMVRNFVEQMLNDLNERKEA
jgi:hypothetical protein